MRRCFTGSVAIALVIAVIACDDGAGAGDDTGADTDADGGADAGECEAAWRSVYPELAEQDFVAVWVGAADAAWIAADSGSDSTGSALFRFDGATWSEQGFGFQFDVTALFGSGPDDVWAVGEIYADAALAHFDGAAWELLDPGFDAWLRAGWASGPDDVYVGGFPGIWRYDGTGWSQVFDPVAEGYGEIGVSALFGCGPGDLYAITSDTYESGMRVFHYDGAAWEQQILVADALPVGGSCAASDDVYLAANAVYHWDGSAWTDLTAAGVVPDAEWRGIYAEGASAAWAVGNAGMARFDGESWSKVALDPWAWPQRIHGRPGAPAFAIGGAGSIFRVTAAAVEPMNQLITPPFVGLAGAAGTIEALSGYGELVRGDGEHWTQAFSWPYWGTDMFGLVPGLAAGSLAAGVRFVPAPYRNGQPVMGPLLIEYGDADFIEIDLGARHLLDMWLAPSGAALFADWDGTVLALADDALVPLAAQPGAAAVALWGAAEDDLWAWCGSEPGAYDAASGGTTGEWPAGVTTSVRHYDGAAWTAAAAPVLEEIPVDLAGAAADDLYALGRRCGVLRYDGATWTQLASPDGLARCEAIAKAGTDLFVAGGGAIWRYDGAAWSASFTAAVGYVSDLWVAANGTAYAAVAGSASGWVHRYDGAAWVEVTAPGGLPPIRALAGAGAVLYAASDAGAIWWFDGAEWTPALSSPRDPFSLLGAAGDGLLAASADGSVFAFADGEWARRRDGLHCGGGIRRLAGNGPDDMLAVCGDLSFVELVGGAWRSVAEGVPSPPAPDYYVEGVASLLAPRGAGQGYYVVHTTTATNAFDSTGEAEAFLYDGAAWTPIGAFPGEEAIAAWGDGGALYVLKGSPTGFPYYADPQVARWDGGAWTGVPVPEVAEHANGVPLFAAPWGGVLLAGAGSLWAWDGAAAQPIPLPAEMTGEVSGIHGRAPDDLFVATSEGAIWSYACE